MSNIKETFNHLEKTFPFIASTLSGYREELLKIDDYEQRANSILDYAKDLGAQLGMDNDALDDSFCEFCIEFLKEQVEFQKENVYSAAGKGFETVVDEVYTNDQYMTDYMIGYILSCALFPHHYKQLTYFTDVFIPSVQGDESCCECGVGHGMYMGSLLKAKPEMKGEGYDVAPACLKLATETMKLYGIDESNVCIELKDVVKHFENCETKYDAVIASGLIEHIEDPLSFLKNVKKALKPNGRLFTMIPTNLSHPDHLIHFNNIQEIIDLFDSSRLSCIDEQVIGVNASKTEKYSTEVHLRISAP